MLGLIGLPLSHYWLVARVEPFYSLIYLFLWWSYIFTADLAVHLLRGNSMLSDRPWEFLVIWFWSMPAWILFEVVNRRIENWYYVMAPTNLFVGGAYLIFGFGAVLPGIFETMDLIVGIVEKFTRRKKIPGRPFTPDRRHIGIQMAIGAAMLVLVLVFPKSCFAMTWGFAFFFLDPLLFWLWRKEPNRIGKSLLGQLAAGDNTRFVALLAGGFLCGGLWEGWNINARTKWIYSVPFFDELKLGEMPILGFLGFPPFALECYAMVNLLSYFRGGRSWELAGVQNKTLRGMSPRGILTTALLLPPAMIFAAYMTLQSVASFAEPFHWHFRSELGPNGISALRNRNALQPHKFLELRERPPEIAEPLWARLRKISALAELKGMGLREALLLEKLNITDFKNLAQQDPDHLAFKLRALGSRIREEQTKVWIQAARKLAPP
jgi:hypothetical protein